MRPPPPGKGAAERGFSLIEATIACLVFLVALGIASELLVESQRRLAVSAHEMLEPEDVIVLRLLRDDLRASAPVGSWGGPLDCRRPDVTASWELEGDKLVRRLLDPDGHDLGARTMLDQVITFRWVPLGGGAVEVEIVRRRLQPGSAVRAGSERWRPIAESLESARIVAASRIES